MEPLKALQDALALGIRSGALIHESSGTACPLEVVHAEGDRLLALASLAPQTETLFRTEARVRIELPKEGSVIFVPGLVEALRAAAGRNELEVRCSGGAEERQRRMDLRADLECRIRVAEGTEWEETRTINLSAGGALLVSTLNAPVASVIEVELQLDEFFLKCQAEVVRRNVKAHGAQWRHGIAVRFLNLSPAVHDRLGFYILEKQARERSRHGR